MTINFLKEPRRKFTINPNRQAILLALPEKQFTADDIHTAIGGNILRRTVKILLNELSEEGVITKVNRTEYRK